MIAYLREQVKLLEKHPEIGRRGRLAGTRELVAGRFPYVVAYRQRGPEVEVLLVVHTTRRWPDEMPK